MTISVICNLEWLTFKRRTVRVLALLMIHSCTLCCVNINSEILTLKSCGGFTWGPRNCQVPRAHECLNPPLVMRMLIGICSSNLKKAVEPEDTKQH